MKDTLWAITAIGVMIVVGTLLHIGVYELWVADIKSLSIILALFTIKYDIEMFQVLGYIVKELYLICTETEQQYAYRKTIERLRKR